MSWTLIITTTPRFPSTALITATLLSHTPIHPFTPTEAALISSELTRPPSRRTQTSRPGAHATTTSPWPRCCPTSTTSSASSRSPGSSTAPAARAVSRPPSLTRCGRGSRTGTVPETLPISFTDPKNETQNRILCPLPLKATFNATCGDGARAECFYCAEK